MRVEFFVASIFLLCRPSFAGYFCKYYSYQSGCWCSNGGTCVSRDYCMCTSTRAGECCNKNNDKTCESQTGKNWPTCLNGGTCSANKQQCNCAPGWSGIYCQTPCPNAPYAKCGGNGHTGATCCQIGYTCVEQSEWHSQCEPSTVAQCDPPCLNGGTCNQPTSNTCTCPPEFTGPNCCAEVSQVTTCGTNPCPVGYTYNVCFNSCYKVVNAYVDLPTALGGCMNDGGHFFVPNSQLEMSAILTSSMAIDIYKEYWFGLQDAFHADKGVVFTFPYDEDPDKIMYWMDGSGRLGPVFEQIRIDQWANVVETGGTSVHRALERDWLFFKSTPGSNKFSFLERENSQWLVNLNSGTDYKPYICEISAACQACPAGWKKFLNKCYLYRSTATTYPEARTFCNTGIANYQAQIWAATTEHEFAYAYYMSTKTFVAEIWLRLSRNGDDFVWENTAIAINSNSPLMIKAADEPNVAENYFRMSGAVDGMRGTSDSRPVVCVIDSPQLLGSAESCTPSCQNGGSCASTNVCSCPAEFIGAWCQINKAYVQSQLATVNQLVAFWPLSKDFGAKDLSPAGIDGTIGGTPTYSYSPVGMPFGSFLCGGTTQPTRYITFESAELDFKATSSSWTLSLWVYAPTSSHPYLIYTDAGGTDKLRMYQFHQTGSSDNKLTLNSDVSGVTDWTMDCPMVNQWQFVAFTFDSGAKELKMFCGSSFLSGSRTSSIQLPTEPKLYLGRQSTKTAASAHACLAAHKAALTADELLKVKAMCGLFSVQCVPACENGGSCVGNNICACPSGFLGGSCSLATANIPDQLSQLPSLLAFWPLTQAYEARDATGTIDGTLSVPSTTMTYSSGPYGILKTAISPSTGTPPRFVSMQDARLNFGAQSWSIFMHVNMRSTTLNLLFEFRKPDNNPGAVFWMKDAANEILFASSVSSTQVRKAPCTIVGTWHFVGIVWNQTAGTFRLFCGSNFVGSASPGPAPGQPNPVTADILSIAYRKSTNTISDNARIACLSVHTDALVLNQILAVKEKCRLFSVAPDSCYLPCQNDGECIGFNLCKCLPTFTGNQCQDRECVPACQNGASCDVDVCDCPAGYTGGACESPICEPECTNNGTCISPGVCSCPAGYAGTTLGCSINEALARSLLAESTGLITFWPLTADYGAINFWNPSAGLDGVITGSPSYQTGPFSVARTSFQTSSSSPLTYISFQAAALARGSSHFSLSGWINVNGGGRHVLLHWVEPTGGAYGVNLYQASSNTLFFDAVVDGNNQISWSCTVTNNWNFIAIRYHGTIKQFRVFCNANNMNAWVGNLNFTAPTYSQFHIGRRPANNDSTANTGDAKFACVSLTTAYVDGAKLSLLRDRCRMFSGMICDSSPCQNGGSCIGRNYCDCPAAWKGYQCETSACTHTCQNGGTCVGAEKCNCAPGYTGTYCATPICTICKHNFTCIAPETCRCDAPLEWYGPDCGTPYCTANCSNNGNCTAPGVCSCKQYWAGDYCQTWWCPNNWCYNGGNCSGPGYCTCHSNRYRGVRCEIPVCIPECSNNGVCMWPGGNQCYCQLGWSGQDCTIADTTVWPGHQVFEAQRALDWTADDVSKKFKLDASAIPAGFTAAPTQAEQCCPCGSFVVDNNCYFVLNTWSSWNYGDPAYIPLYVAAECAAYGGVMATFETTDGQAKLAAFIKWYAVEHNIQTDQRPVDHQGDSNGGNPCFIVGAYRDQLDGAWYWQTNPPSLVSSSLWMRGEPRNDLELVCVMPHKTRPYLRTYHRTWTRQPVVCMIRNPCNSLAVCKTGVAKTHIENMRLFDRCYSEGVGPGDIEDFVNRLDAEKACQKKGGFLSSIRYQYEPWYWAFALDTRWSDASRTYLSFKGHIWNYMAWVGYNHLHSDYYWESANKQLMSPYNVRWAQGNAGQPDEQGSSKCAVAQTDGWYDERCDRLEFNIACESDVIDVTKVEADEPEPDDGCVEPCPTVVECPAGYFYNACLDACFYISGSGSTNTKYWEAMTSCYEKQATLMSFTSLAEFELITSQLRTDRCYHIGLQDFARRSSGNLTFNSIESYSGDADSVWTWPEEGANVSTIRYQDILNGNKVPSGEPFTYIVWEDRPNPPTDKNQQPFVAFLKYDSVSSRWFIPISDSGHPNDFTNECRYVCKYSAACTRCPTGWRKFGTKCYKSLHDPADPTTMSSYSNRRAACRTEHSSAIIFAPKTEAEVLFVRTSLHYVGSVDFAGASFWIGLEKQTDGTWKWSDGEAVSENDALDIVSGLVLGDADDSFIVRVSTGDTSIRNVQDDTVTTWRPVPSSDSHYAICQMSGTWNGYLDETPTTTAVAHDCVNDGCCNCPYLRYQDLTNGVENCYYFSNVSDTWLEAQWDCTMRNGYLAVTDTGSKMQFLLNHAKFVEDKYWTALSLNSYGIWTWPNTPNAKIAELSNQVIGSLPWPTDPSCLAAVLSKSDQMLKPICNTTTSFVTSSSIYGNRTFFDTSARFPYICEQAHAVGVCLTCQRPPLAQGLRKIPKSLSGYRVSPDKCLWFFNNATTKNLTDSRCKAAGLRPVTLFQNYEHSLMVQFMNKFQKGGFWLDLGMRTSTPWEWEGEPSTYHSTRLAESWTNNWHQSCAAVHSNQYLYPRNCGDRKIPVCTLPSAATCADLCPEGYTAFGGSCYMVATDATFSDPFAARANCFNKYNSYNLASVTSLALLQFLGTLVSDAKVAMPGQMFWIGLDDSLRSPHAAVGTTSDIQTVGDPDGVWELDNTQPFPNGDFGAPTDASFWDTDFPVTGHHWAYAYWNNGELKVRTTLKTSPPTAYGICERPLPCFECDHAVWNFFNGKCYRKINTPSSTKIRGARQQCDFFGAHLTSINSPIEERFVRVISGTSGVIIAGHYLQQLHSTPFKDFHYDMEEGGWSDAAAGYTNWRSGEPNNWVNSETITCVSLDGSGWNDCATSSTVQPTVCERPALTPVAKCPKVVSTGSVCSDSVATSVFIPNSSGFESSPSVTEYPPRNVALMMPWAFDPAQVTPSTPPWIRFTFANAPIHVRAIATMGAIAPLHGRVVAYTVTYKVLEADVTERELYVHKSTAYWNKQMPLIFAGNGADAVRNSQEICPRIRATQLTIWPASYIGAPFMRIDVKGCPRAVNVSTFCECWIELFAGQTSYDSSYPFLLETVTADSGTATSANGFVQSDMTSSIPGWSPTTFGDGKNWWQIEFNVLKVVTGLVMMGKGASGRIKSYHVQWSHTGYYYTFNYYYALDGNPRLFMGPPDGSMPIQQTFCPPMKTKVFRILPVEYETKPFLIVNLFGCLARNKRCFDCCDEIGLCTCSCPVGFSGSTCSQATTNERNYYIDAQAPVCTSADLIAESANKWSGEISVTPSTNSWTWAGDAYAYLASPLQSYKQYIQINFQKVISLSSIEMAGRTSSNWITSYALWFLVENTNDQLFYPILKMQANPNSEIVKIPGARDNSRYTPYYLCPAIKTSMIRLVPLTFEGAPEARLKISGCPQHAPCTTCCTNDAGCQCKCPIGYSTVFGVGYQPNPWPHCDQWSMMPIDCEDVAMRQTSATSGIYVIYPPGAPAPITVWCDMTRYGGGWTVLQRRFDKTQGFFQTWEEYKLGFGNLDTNFWLGNDNIHRITSGINTYDLLIVMTTNEEELGLAYYKNFYIESEAEGYRLRLGSFDCATSNVGDSLLAFHDGEKFFARDNDTTGSYKCASNSYGGWWYKNSGTNFQTCHESNLNGLIVGTNPGSFMSWKTWRGYWEPLKSTTIMIRRSPLPHVMHQLRPNYPVPIDCEDIRDTLPTAASTNYTIYPPLSNGEGVNVYCEMSALGGGWTVLQRRYFDASVSFNTDFGNYTRGFGSVLGAHYLGNRWIYEMTAFFETNLPYQLAVVLEDSRGQKRTSTYQAFWLSNNSTYNLNVYGYNANGETLELAGDALSPQNGESFKTYETTSWSNCRMNSGWWWRSWLYTGYWSWYAPSCGESNLNGQYDNNTWENGIYWANYRGRLESLKTATLMIKRSVPKPLDCQDVFSQGISTNGVDFIYPFGMRPLQVFCDMKTEYRSERYSGNKGWIVIQSRTNFDVSFNRPWVDYRYGFGSKTGDHWLGLENLYQLTKSTAYSLLVTLKNPEDNLTYFAYYDNFRVGSEAEFYPLLLSGFDDKTLPSSANAGDALAQSNEQTFSTADHGQSKSCMLDNGGVFSPWWLPTGRCNDAQSNLNGVKNDARPKAAVFWETLASDNTSMLVTKMAIRRKARLLQDCETVAAGLGSGVYWLTLPDGFRFKAYCDMSTDYDSDDYPNRGSGWTVVQRRVDGLANFSRDWSAYKNGFTGPSGLAGDHWLGLEKFYRLTISGPYSLLVTCKKGGQNYYSYYDVVRLAGEQDKYRLHIAYYDSSLPNSKKAGDALGSYLHNGQEFVTLDRANTFGSNCMLTSSTFGAFWFIAWNKTVWPAATQSFAPACVTEANLNSPNWGSSTDWRGVLWKPLTDKDSSCQETQMAIKMKKVDPTINIPHASTTSLCGALGILKHKCDHTYKAISGDTIRLMIPDRSGVYGGSDLSCKPYLEPQDCTYKQRTLPPSTRFLSQPYSDLVAETTSGTTTFTGFCDMETFGGGWTVIQRRVDAKQTFLLDLTAYELSFGSTTGNFWLGNSIIRGLTQSAKYELLVELRVGDNYAFALYSLFYTETGAYVLRISDYQTCSTVGDSLTRHNDLAFSYDPCGAGGWWFQQSACPRDGNNANPTSNLNAPYGTQPQPSTNIYWWSWNNGFSPSMAWTKMSVRRYASIRGRYLKAPGFHCDNDANAVLTASATTPEKCTDACSKMTDFTCTTAVFKPNTSECFLQREICQPPSEGALDESVDTYYRLDTCEMFPGRCGPPPTMAGTDAVISSDLLPGQVTVNYTCSLGFTNSLWSGDWTALTCNQATKQWQGRWMDCRTLCGYLPDLSSLNAIRSPEITIGDGIMTLYYVCAPDFELTGFGLPTRICAPPYGAWIGDDFICKSTRCPYPPEIAFSTNNFTVPVPVPYDDRNRRYTVWAYTCDRGYVFVEAADTFVKTKTIQCNVAQRWEPANIGRCIPFNCANPPNFVNVKRSSSVPLALGAVYEFGTEVVYECYGLETIDPMLWDSKVTIACIGNQTWAVTNYTGQTLNWLPSACTCGFNSSTWPAGIVPFVIDPSINEAFEIRRIADLITMLNSQIDCIELRQRIVGTDEHYINFTRSPDDTCKSEFMGFADIGGQAIFLAPNCSVPRFLYWVLLQTLGLPAEHMRPDRDDYVTVVWENIKPGQQYRDAFLKYEYIDARLLALPYDFSSRLHYSGEMHTVTRGKKTMMAKDDPGRMLGNPLAPTKLDLQKVEALYCSDKTTPATEEPPTSPETTDYSTTDVEMTTEEPETTTEATTTTSRPPRRSGGAPVGPRRVSTTTELPTTTSATRPGDASIAPRVSGRGSPSQNQGLMAMLTPVRSSAKPECICLDRPNTRGACESQHSFQFKYMERYCLGNASAHPVCQCDNVNVNPCICEPKNGRCVKACFPQLANTN